MWLAVIMLATCGAAAAADAPEVLHSFGVSERGGSDLYAGLVLDAAGNLYGAAESGGRYGFGIVYKLSPGSGGAWTETVLYSFRGGHDGASPHATLAWDSAGNLYGTTVSGGGSTACGGGCGVVYRLTPSSGGWTETVLHRFAGGADGLVPYPGVVIDTAGNVYGATLGGGAGTLGTVYELAPGSGTWTHSVLHSFTGTPDGSTLYATPVLDSAGNLYGTTYTGGTHNKGTVFTITSAAGGGWTERVLYSFKGGSDGANPMAPVTFDQNGNLYGTTEAGGTANCGTAYRLTPNQTGAWSESVLHTFLGVTVQDGENPNGLIFDTHGNLFGTSLGGGVDNPGTIFELSPMPDGSWMETVLYSFTAGLDGAYPSAGLTMDAAGNLYGTTLWGGPSGDTTGGVAFEYTP
ncbi:MAG: choice-of-anchor tandem repeat GloVer-containing protein [Bryobacteraceae bacterium]